MPLMPAETFDLIFADPPYFLSNNGSTCHPGKMVSVNKGKWDKSRGAEADHEQLQTCSLLRFMLV
jgi:site-specific DNA-methyltransferase (adenine-specific)